MRFLKIDLEEFRDLDLNISEMGLLSVYKYFTKEGKLKYCSMTNGQIAEMLKLDVRTVQRMKMRLKELGYIRSDGGIKVWYLGVKKKGVERKDDMKEDDVVSVVMKEMPERFQKEEVVEFIRKEYGEMLSKFMREYGMISEGFLTRISSEVINNGLV